MPHARKFLLVASKETVTSIVLVVAAAVVVVVVAAAVVYISLLLHCNLPFFFSFFACLIICDVKPVNRSYFVRLSIFRFPKNSFHCELTCASVHTAVDTEEFKTYFNKYGLVTDAIVMTDKQTGRSRGFGFITFETAVSFVCV